MTKVNESKLIWNLTYMLHTLGIAPTQEEFDEIFYNLRERFEARERWNPMVRLTRCR